MKTTDVVNLTDLQKKYEELGAEIEALKEQGVIDIWPKYYGDNYYSVASNNSIMECVWANHEMDKARKAAHNIFRTKEEAQAKADWRQMTDDLWAYAKEVNGGWEADWGDVSIMKYSINFYKESIDAEKWVNYNFGTPAFKSKALAQQAINHFGDRLNILRDYRG